MFHKFTSLFPIKQMHISKSIYLYLHRMRRILVISLLLSFTFYAAAQRIFEGVASFDKTVHDFGKIKSGKGPMKCTFTLTNVSQEPLNIFAVLSSCGCTKVVWTRSEIAPGKTGSIEAEYANDEGPEAFDKTLRVYINDIKKPQVLHIKGEATK